MLTPSPRSSGVGALAVVAALMLLSIVATGTLLEAYSDRPVAATALKR